MNFEVFNYINIHTKKRSTKTIGKKEKTNHFNLNKENILFSLAEINDELVNQIDVIKQNKTTNTTEFLIQVTNFLSILYHRANELRVLLGNYDIITNKETGDAGEMYWLVKPEAKLFWEEAKLYKTGENKLTRNVYFFNLRKHNLLYFDTKMGVKCIEIRFISITISNAF